jgi:type IV secretory pathway VirB4 component
MLRAQRGTASCLESCNGDADLVRYLQICTGVCLSGLVEEHLFFLVLGPAGTGKSTFGEVLMSLMGDYALGVDPNTRYPPEVQQGFHLFRGHSLLDRRGH